MAKLINELSILGVGLIGGSLARALKRARACATITGFDSDSEALDRAVQSGVVDQARRDPVAAVRGADVVVLATPIGAMEKLLQRIRPGISTETVITDVGSVKGSVVNAARAALGQAFSRFVPGHPIAGTERSGVDASFAGLFENRLVILTPVQETEVRALSLVSQLWERAGAQVATLSVQGHDRILAATSHLPHMLAFALVDCLADMDDSEEVFRYAAGGFADFSRIASSSPVMWRDICLANRDGILKALDSFGNQVEALRRAVEQGDGARLLEIFTRARTARDEFQRQFVPGAPASER